MVGQIGPKRDPLSFTYALYTKVGNLIDGTTSLAMGA